MILKQCCAIVSFTQKNSYHKFDRIWECNPENFPEIILVLHRSSRPKSITFLEKYEAESIKKISYAIYGEQNIQQSVEWSQIKVELYY